MNFRHNLHPFLPQILDPFHDDVATCDDDYIFVFLNGYCDNVWIFVVVVAAVDL